MDDRLHAEQVGHLAAVLQAAQAEAAEWQLGGVELWGPSPWVRNAVAQLSMSHSLVERRRSGVAGGLWYEEAGDGAPPTWINNEHYAWC